MTSSRPDTLWTRTGSTPPVTGHDALPARVDTVVIGGGFTGLTAARALLKAGRRVTVLEAGPIGAGASAVNAGFVVPNFAKADPSVVRGKLGNERGDRLLRLVSQGADTVFSTIREDGIACDAAQTGWLQPAYGEDMATVLRRRAATWQELDRPVEFLDAAEVTRQTSIGIYSGGLIDRSGGTIHPLDYLYGLARTILSLGGIIREQSPVERVARSGSGCRIVFSGGEITADSVLLCTNAFTSGIAAKTGLTGVPLRVYQVATRPVPPEIVARIAPDRLPVGDTRQNLFTYRLDRDNRLISGGMSVIPIGATERVARAVVGRLAAELRLPEHPGIEVGWTGVALMTPDFLPRLHAFGDGFFGGIGCNGRGIAMTAQLGRVLAEAALGAPLDSLAIPVVPVRPLPFHAFTPLVASAALAHARLKDRLAR